VNLLAEPSVGALCALGSAFTWAVTSMLARTLQPPLTSVSINAIRSTVAGVVLLGWVVAVDGVAVMTSISATTFGLLALSIAIAVGVGDNFFFESSRMVGLAAAMTIATSYPLITTVLAALVLGEAITMWVVIGGAMTLAGVVLIISGGQHRAERHEHYGLGVAAAALASLAWGIAPILMKTPLQEMDAAAAQAVRLPVAAALLWITPWARGAVRQLVEGGQGLVGRMALLSLLTVFSSVMYVAGIKYAGVAVGSILSSVAPMFAIALGVIFLHERLSPGAVLGILVTIAGVIVLQF
jgi:drug/metabolite transporter (DMT)-like permease